jgi:hypothetical protein
MKQSNLSEVQMGTPSAKPSQVPLLATSAAGLVLAMPLPMLERSRMPILT